jgi:two-component system nitrogen regulation response regulator NtrX
MSTDTRVLLVDRAAGAEDRAQLLRTVGHRVDHVRDLDDAAARLGSADVVVLEHALGGLPAIDRLLAAPGGRDVAIVVLLGEQDLNDARATLRNGGCDAVLGSAGNDAVVVAVERAAREAQLRRELALLRARAGADMQHVLIGRSSTMSHVRQLIARAAASRAATLVMGEAGTGKDVVARLIHDLSDRAARPFVVVSCAETDASSLETRLFGRAGSPELALAGALERASGGTLVLDGAPSAPAALQARLARAVAPRTAPRGSGDAVVDVRLVLCARIGTEDGRSDSHDDLIDRFNALPIVVPPLRERRSDIPQLVHHFRSRIAPAGEVAPHPLGSEALLPLLGHDWPGNVRELEQWVERASLATTPGRPGSETTAGRAELAGLDLGSARVTLEELERAYILHVLDQESGHQSRAAVRLGIDRRTLYRKLKQYRSAERQLQHAG